MNDDRSQPVADHAAAGGLGEPATPRAALREVVAYIALGSNLGDRARVILSALDDLDGSPGIAVARVSQLIETAPEGPPDQAPYLNGAAELRTSLAPRTLLDRMLEIERRHGRDRSRGVPNGPRTLDLDLLLFGREVHDAPGLIVPHPRMHTRRFVLQPLAELAPEAMHPTLAVSVRSLLDSLHQVP